MDTSHPEGAPTDPRIAPRDTSHPRAGTAISRLARTVTRLTRSGLAALDADLLQALVELGDEARAIAQVASEYAALMSVLQELHGFGHFDPTGTECDDAYRIAKRRARRAATGAPSALWVPQAECELLESWLAAPDAPTLDRMVCDLAEASGYLALIDLPWDYWHLGRHAEQAASLGMDDALERLFSAAWQIQHYVVGVADAAESDHERQRIRAAHRAAQGGPAIQDKERP